MAEPVVVLLPPGLRFLLHPRDRDEGRRVLRFDPDATVGHLVQAAGVPLTEVGSLGLDVRWSNDADDPALVARAAAEERVLLTQDRRLLMRRALPAGALVRGSRPDDQLADVLSRFAPALAPLTRCTVCGGVLAPVPKEQVADRLLPGTRRSYDAFARCQACGRVYWQGAHARRIGRLVTTSVGNGTTLGRTTEHSQQGSASALRVRETADPRT